MLLEKRPETLEATKFEGGPEGAQQVIEWALAHDRRMIISWTPEVLNDGEVVVKEALYVIIPNTSKYNRSERGLANGNKTFRMNIGEWLVLDKKHGHAYSSDGFDLFRAYKEVDEGADARPE